MWMSQIHRSVITIKNKLGLHARPAMALVDLANRFAANLTLKRADSEEAIDGKSIMQVMMLAATQGTKLCVEADGPDAQEMVSAIEEIVNRSFDED